MPVKEVTIECDICGKQSVEKVVSSGRMLDLPEWSLDGNLIICKECVDEAETAISDFCAKYRVGACDNTQFDTRIAEVCSAVRSRVLHHQRLYQHKGFSQLDATVEAIATAR